jgi:DNA-binding IclR family transcriptional regulator
MRNVIRTKVKEPSARAARTYSVPALDKGIDIIELLAGEKNGLLISEIAYRLKRSMSEIFRIVVTLERRDWLQKDRESSRYGVTYRMMELAHRGTPAQAMSLVAAPVLSQLSRQIEQSCHIVVPAGGHGLVVLRQENAGHPGGFAMRLGAVVDLLASCGGHVLLAFMETVDREILLQRLPTPWPMRKAELLRRLVRVRKQGFEMQPSHISASVTEISYPIHARDAKVVAALTVPYLRPNGKASPMSIAQMRAAIAEAAQRISHTLATIR